MKQKFLFLDRDGTICTDQHYLDDYRRMEIYPFAAEAVRMFRAKGYKVAIITNQSGVARGRFSIDEAERQKKHVIDYFRREGAELEGYYYCPHYRDGDVAEYAVECDCRKPGPGMVREAVAGHDVDWGSSIVAGDKMIDVELAQILGMRGALVLTGHGREHARRAGPKVEIFRDILELAEKL